MRLQWALLFSAAALGAQAQLVAPDAAPTTTALARRQDVPGEASSEVSEPAAEETSQGAGDDESSSDDGGNNSSPPAEETSSSASQSEEDTTVFRTETVTDGDAETITRRTTTQSTSTFTVVVIQTVFETKTITQKGETATRTIWETSTVVDNGKREFVDLGPRTLPIAVEAHPTEAAVPTVTREDWDQLEMAKKRMQRDNMLNKRATVTEVRTVTVGDDSQTTVVDTVTQTVVVTRSTARTTTNEVTETEIEDASTTETVTRTLTVTSTAVTTGAQTTTGGETGDSNSDSSSSDDGGLSTGAKAGIGAGVGVAALLALGALAWFCIRRRRRGPKADPDSLAGASEVPVGGPVGSTPPMSHQSSTHHAAAAGLLAPGGRGAASKPSPEGYRGTAMGDGRAGYAKPAPYGAAYTQPSSTSPTNRSSTLNSSTPFSPGGQTVSSIGNDSLPSHPGPNDHQAAELGNDNNAAASRWQPSGNAAEMDAAGVGHQSGALPQNVYEMPAQNYR